MFLVSPEMKFNAVQVIWFWCELPSPSGSGSNQPTFKSQYFISLHTETTLSFLKVSQGLRDLCLKLYRDYSPHIVKCKNIKIISFTAGPKDTAGDFWYIYTQFLKVFRESGVQTSGVVEYIYIYFRNRSNILICCSINISYYQCWKLLFCLIFLLKLWYFFSGFFWCFE